MTEGLKWYHTSGHMELDWETNAHDDYLITPQFTITSGTSDYFSVVAFNGNASSLDTFDILLSTAGNSVAEFTTTIASGLTPPYLNASAYTYDLSAHVGQTVYLAFRATSVGGESLYIDNFQVANAAILSVEDNVIEGFSLYPNPGNDRLHLTALDNIEELSVYNLLGQEVLRTQPKVLSTQVDMSNLRTGVYVVKVKVGQQLGSYRIIKE